MRKPGVDASLPEKPYFVTKEKFNIGRFLAEEGIKINS
jgi:hypothetical protein